MTPGEEFRLYMKAANRDRRNSSDSHLSEATLIAYYRDDISEAERETAQAHLVTCASCIALLQSVSDFLEPAGSDEEDVAEAETNAEWQSFVQRVKPSNFKPAPDKKFFMDSRLTLAMAASLLISLGAVGWLAWSNWQERQSRRQSQEVAAELQNRQRELEQRLAQLTESDAREREQRLAVQEELDKLQDLVAATRPSEDDARVYRLRPPADRGAAEDLQLKLNTAAVVHLFISKPGAFGQYEIDILDEGGRSVRKFRGLRPQGFESSLRFRLNRGALSPGKYKLRLSGRQGSESTQVGEYNLVVTS
ncbi:MAG TPA: hypothetical protein VJT15_09505 [Pyrinomonadaceae bacterium]|nr:hypothetical protein [Pyrinomonadaceae bacterium]